MPNAKWQAAMESMKETVGCSHDFLFEREHPIEGGVVGVCRACHCRVTAWPGGAHYDDINAVRAAAIATETPDAK